MAKYSLFHNYFLNTQTAYDQARAVIIPVPYEKTVSYGGGTKHGPAAILSASHFLEPYDSSLAYEPCSVGIHTASAVRSLRGSQVLLDRLEKKVAGIVQDGKFPVILGGEHTLSAGAVHGALRSYPDLSVLHFDAHTDCRSTYQGSTYSHACALYRIRLRTKKTISVGIRSSGKEELPYLKKEKVKIIHARDVAGERSIPATPILKALSNDVFISFDVDALDPSIIEQTGTPEPGGLHWYQTLELLQQVFRHKNVVGFDIVELAPNPAHPNADFTTATLLYKMLGFKFLR